jgi:hypothetical protein
VRVAHRLPSEEIPVLRFNHRDEEKVENLPRQDVVRTEPDSTPEDGRRTITFDTDRLTFADLLKQLVEDGSL